MHFTAFLPINSTQFALQRTTVDRTTITRRLRGGLSHVEAAQPSLLLSTEQERLFVRWILDLERAENPPNHTQIREIHGVNLSSLGYLYTRRN